MVRRWPSVFALLAALVAVGATGWLLLREGRANRDDSSSTRPAVAPHVGPDRGDERPPPQRVEVEAGEAAEPKPAVAADLDDAIARAGLDAAAGPESGLEIDLVERTSRAPRPGVPVLLFVSDRPRASEIWNRRLDPKWLRREHAAALRSDDDGRIRVALPARGAMLVAEQGDERGVLFVPSGTSEPATLELGAPLELAVHVVDGSGSGRAGVDVALARRGQSVAASGVARATTDGSGLATLRDLDLELNGRATTRGYWVGLAFPLGEARGRDVELAGPPAAAVELELPPTGTLALQVVAPDGTPLPIAGSAELRTSSARGAAKSSRSRPSHGHDESFLVPIAADGSATVANVGVGLRFEIDVKLAGRQAATTTADGPARAEQRVTIALPAGAAGPIVSGRALDAARNPIADVDLAAGLEARDRPPPQGGALKSNAKTDDEGRFVFDLSRADAAARAGPATLSIARQTAKGDPVAGARIEVATVAAAVDVGDVVVADLPLLCSGRVVDERGEPVANATVEVVPGNPSGPGCASDLADRCHSHHDGRFELRGAAPAAPSCLKASAHGYASGAPAPFVPGAQELELVLPRAGAIVGSLLLGEAVTSRDFRTWIKRVDGSTTSSDFGEGATLGAAGGFRFDGLAAGTFDVRLGLREAAGETPAHVDVAGVEVRAGETTRDERLNAIDVARLLRLVVIDARDEDGTPVASGTVATLATSATGSLPRVEARLKEGRALLSGPADSFDLELLAPGFRPARVAARPGALTLVLKRGLPVHVVAPLDHPRDPELVLNRVRLVPAGAEEAKHAPATSVRIGPSGEGDAVVPLAGKYVAVLEYRRRDQVDSRKRRAAAGSPASLEVACEVADRRELQTLKLPSPR